MESELELGMTPSGRLRLGVVAGAAASWPRVRDLEAALAESNAAGLVLLASPGWPNELPPTLVFWRDWARSFFRRVCHDESSPGDAWRRLACLADDALRARVESAPPMSGLEYLTVDWLRWSWSELAEYAADRGMAHAEGPAAWLSDVSPLAHLVGKVTFHLAENKRDPERPFAFLATYAHQLSARSKPQHRPLADALKQSIAESDSGMLERLLEPVRRAAARSPLASELLRAKRLFSPQFWTAAEAYRFMQESPAMEEAGVVIRLPNWWAVRRQTRPQVQVRIGAKEPPSLGLESLLDFHVQVAMDGEPLSADELKRLLSEAPGLTLLRGKWVEVDQRKLQEALTHWKQVGQEYGQGVGMIEGMRLLAGAAIEAPESASPDRDSWTTLVAGDWLRQTLERMRAPGADDECQPGRELQATLRPYQEDGVRWLWFMTQLGLGACLADDMGLGKTIQVLDLLLQCRRAAQRLGRELRPSLLIVPASLMGNWKQEAARFAPSLRVAIVHRAEMAADELTRRTADPELGFRDVDLVITSYGMVRRQAWLERVRWPLVILDEAQAIKNDGSAQTKAVKRLQGERRIVMTGTPIENHVGELWSLFDFSSPGLLGTSTQFKRFVSRLSALQDPQAFGALRRLVRPYILRRQKTDPAIAADLPSKIEMRTECGLATPQAVLYAKAVEALARELKHAEGMQRRGLVLATLMQLKQICNHPAQYLREPDYAPEASGKFERLAQLCEPIAARQEKVLVFTQFQSLCEPLANYLASVFGQPGLVLHGATPVGKRSELVKQFQNDSNRSFFVISLKAGGSGLNLTAASHVVHFDRWWNPAVENQATDRAFRIGQKRNVLVHKFVCRGTIEERIDAMIAGKKAVAEQVLDADGAPRITEWSNDELLEFVSLDLSRATDEGGSAKPTSAGRKRK